MRNIRRGAAILALSMSGALLSGTSWAHVPDGDRHIPQADTNAAAVSDPISENFELVGHSPLNNRGMNSAVAVHEATPTSAAAPTASRTTAHRACWSWT